MACPVLGMRKTIVNKNSLKWSSVGGTKTGRRVYNMQDILGAVKETENRVSQNENSNGLHEEVTYRTRVSHSLSRR